MIDFATAIVAVYVASGFPFFPKNTAEASRTAAVAAETSKSNLNST